MFFLPHHLHNQYTIAVNITLLVEIFDNISGAGEPSVSFLSDIFASLNLQL